MDTEKILKVLKNERDCIKNNYDYCYECCDECCPYYVSETEKIEVFDFLINAYSMQKPKGDREFIEIITRYFPDDIVTYPEYRGKPYYSIHYRENGEEFVGYGTYNPDILSRYLRIYFFGQKGGEDNV